MKVVLVRFKKGLKEKIKDTAKEYYYFCPLKDIEIGDYVLVEVKKYRDRTFGVARIESIKDMNIREAKELNIRGMVALKIPIDDFDHRCKLLYSAKMKLYSKYKELDKEKIQ